MQDDQEEKKEIPETEEAVDDVVEFVFNDDGEEDIKATLKKFRKDLKDCKKEKEEYLAQLQRERADFINYKRDEETRVKDKLAYSRERLIMDFLPVLDSYDMAFANKDAWEKVDKNWRMGVEYIHQQLLKVLADYNVSPIDTKIGDAFDPNIHQSIENVPTDDESKDHTIAQITQSGYKLGDKIIRPARVNVFALKDL
jgi:molecular chaperone GrpE